MQRAGHHTDQLTRIAVDNEEITRSYRHLQSDSRR
jgi:hypothetical protein